MNITIYIQICSFVYFLVLCLVFCFKNKMNNIETRLYRVFLIVNFFGLIIDISLGYVSPYVDFSNVLYRILAKMYLIYFVTWVSLLSIYMYVVTFNIKTIIVVKNSRKMINNYFKKFSLIYLINIILIVLFPNYFFRDTYGTHSYGLATSYTYICSGCYVILSLYFIFKNRIKANFKKYLPVILFLILGILTMLIQRLNPSIILTPTVMTLITFIMYHTIENPDMKLLEELHKAKEISDNANEEKTLFLYNMTQEIRHTASKINEEADIIIDSEDIEVDKDSARNIKGETAKFRSTVNDIMDVSAIDTSSIKIYNSKYNVVNLLKEIVSMYNGICLNKELSFRINIEHDIPELLYGDSIGLKKSIMNVLTFSINNNNTKKGYLEFSVNTVRKKDILRLIITIEDNGVGIGSNELEKIKINDKYLSLAYKLVTLMNGTMIIASDYGMGNKIKIVIDQRVVDNISKEERQYNEVYQDKKILVVDDNEASCKIIEKLLKGSNITIDKVNTGKDCLNKIREKNKYDLILLDEELKQITGMELLAKLKEVRNFNIPVILLSKDNSYEYNEEYLKNGFCSVIIKPIKKEVLLEKIDKFTLM